MNGITEKIEIEQTIKDQDGNEYTFVEEVYNKEKKLLDLEFWKAFKISENKKDAYKKIVGE